MMPDVILVSNNKLLTPAIETNVDDAGREFVRVGDVELRRPAIVPFPGAITCFRDLPNIVPILLREPILRYILSLAIEQILQQGRTEIFDRHRLHLRREEFLDVRDAGAYGLGALGLDLHRLHFQSGSDVVHRRVE